MFYLTKSNYEKLVHSLDVDIPVSVLRSFYQEINTIYSFPELNMQAFSADQIRRLYISDLLYQKTAAYCHSLLIRRIDTLSDYWVFKVVQPCYHHNSKCQFAHNNFVNKRIPRSVVDAGHKEAYRQFILENLSKTDSHIGYSALEDFACTLKDNFDLTETIEEIIKQYISDQRFSNSEMMEFNANLDFEKEYLLINKQITAFKNFMKETYQCYLDNRKNFKMSFNTHSYRHFESYYGKKASLYAYEDIELTKFEREFMQGIYGQKSALLSRIMNFHFQKLQLEGFDLSERFLHLLGFKPCSHCVKEK